MATHVRIRGDQMLPLVSALASLSVWLKPGKLALRVGQIRHALLPDAKELGAQLEKLDKEHPELREQVYQHIEVDGEKRLVVVTGSDGTPLMGPKIENGQAQRQDMEAYEHEQKALLDEVFSVTIVRCLTTDDIERVEEMTRRMKPEDESKAPPVDFGAIAAVVNETADIVSSDIPEDQKFLPGPADADENVPAPIRRRSQRMRRSRTPQNGEVVVSP